MIEFLVIGGSDALSDVARTYRPSLVRSYVQELHGYARRLTVRTWNPLVIYEVIKCWDKAHDALDRIYLDNGVARAVKLTAVFERDWLAHFGIEDLYMRGEFDGWLDPPVVEPGSK